mmetsp:Transcript_23680/g.73381  ORF Transcript_23680/g.73381 Transcript_23680/m.73381 type:complete len:245 (-) Transcript_23680:1758-2492(-)
MSLPSRHSWPMCSSSSEAKRQILISRSSAMERAAVNCTLAAKSGSSPIHCFTLSGSSVMYSMSVVATTGGALRPCTTWLSAPHTLPGTSGASWLATTEAMPRTSTPTARPISTVCSARALCTAHERERMFKVISPMPMPIGERANISAGVLGSSWAARRVIGCFASCRAASRAPVSNSAKPLWWCSLWIASSASFITCAAAMAVKTATAACGFSSWKIWIRCDISCRSRSSHADTMATCSALLA